MGIFKPNVEKMERKRNVEGLVTALRYKDSVVRGKAAEALERLSWQSRDEVERAWYFLASSAWKSLVDIGKPAVEPLVQALKDESVYVLANAAKVLGEIGDARAIEPLVQALRDVTAKELFTPYYFNTSDVRVSAAKALGEIGDARAVEPLIQALKDENFWVRANAAKALGKIGDARAVEALLQVLKDDDCTKGHREDAAGTLGRIGDLRAAEGVIVYISNNFYASLRESDLSNLLGGYTNLILEALLAGDYCPTFYKRSVRAIDKLCSINTHISNNILHILSKKRTFTVYVSDGCTYGNVEESFEFQRKKAEDELKRRGNPTYDSSIYLNKEAWNL